MNKSSSWKYYKIFQYQTFDFLYINQTRILKIITWIIYENEIRMIIFPTWVILFDILIFLHFEIVILYSFYKLND
jgi:hypothetical protein